MIEQWHRFDMQPIEAQAFHGDEWNVVRFTWEDYFPAVDAGINTWLLTEMRQAARASQQEIHIQRLFQSSGSAEYIVLMANLRVFSWSITSVRRDVVMLEIVAYPDYWEPDYHPALHDILVNQLFRFLQWRQVVRDFYQPAPAMPDPTSQTEPMPIPPVRGKTNYNRARNAWAAQQLSIGRNRDEVFQVWAQEGGVNMDDRSAVVKAREAFKKAMQRAENAHANRPARGKPRSQK